LSRIQLHFQFVGGVRRVKIDAELEVRRTPRSARVVVMLASMKSEGDGAQGENRRRLPRWLRGIVLAGLALTTLVALRIGWGLGAAYAYYTSTRS
jgi:hypothetical protein